MAAGDFHARPYDEGTLTKLRIFELYAREWLPVFLASPTPIYRELHVFDFFAGPGRDVAGVLGSPLRLLQQFQEFREQPGWSAVRVAAHFSDADAQKIGSLREAVSDFLPIRGLTVNIEACDFAVAFRRASRILRDSEAAKLVFIDQSGVDQVTPDVFRLLAGAPACDFIFFVASQALHRFAEHPAIRITIKRPHDRYHVHRATWQYYREMLPLDSKCMLGRFSIRKGPNIYGLIYGTRHPLGMDKFLEVAWKQDQLAGEANFDIDRDDAGPLFSGLLPPTKISVFEQELEHRIRAAAISSEADVIRTCFEHGVRRSHAAPVLRRLKDEGIIEVTFRVPEVRRMRNPRPVRLRGRHA